MSFVRIDRPASGPQVFVAGHRVHHFTTGLLAILGGLAACWHDRRDARTALSDLWKRS